MRSSLHHTQKTFHTVIAGELMQGACNNENRLDFITSIKKDGGAASQHITRSKLVSDAVSGRLKNVFASPQKRSHDNFLPSCVRHECDRLLSAREFVFACNLLCVYSSVTAV